MVVGSWRCNLRHYHHSAQKRPHGVKVRMVLGRLRSGLDILGRIDHGVNKRKRGSEGEKRAI